MKKFKTLKVTVLFLLFLCAISLIFAKCKSIYINQKSEKIKEEIISNIAEIKEGEHDAKTKENSKAELKAKEDINIGVNSKNSQEETKYFSNRQHRYN